MNKREELKKTIRATKEGFLNYPLTIIVLFCIFVLSVVNIEKDGIGNMAYIIQGLFVFASISLVIKDLVREKFKASILVEFLLYLVSGLVIYIYYKRILLKAERVEYIRVIILNIIFYLIFILTKKVEDEDFPKYIIRVVGDLIVSFIYSLVLYLGLAFILVTLNSLFRVNIYGRLYLYISMFIMMLVFPLIFLSRYRIDKDYKGFNYPKSLKGLFNYILIPLSLIYILILYLYFIKLLISQEFPKGLVSHLVLWFSLVATTIMFFIEPIKKENRLLEGFFKYFPIALLPILVLVFISMGIRVREYGLTENRYLVLALASWIGLSNLYMIFKKDYKTRFLAIILLIVLVFTILGPANAFSLSKRSQKNRLERILVKNNMLEDDVLVKGKDIGDRDKRSIYSIVDYFRDSHSLAYLDILGESYSDSDFENVFGFSVGPNSFGDIVYMGVDSSSIVDITGYDYMIDIDSYRDNILKENDLEIDFNYETNNLTISKMGNVFYKLNINKIAYDLYKKNEGKNNIDSLVPEDLSYMDENDRLEIKLMFEDIDLDLTEKSFENGNFKLLFKLK